MDWFFKTPDAPLVDLATDADFDALASIHSEGFPHGWDAGELAALAGQPVNQCYVARRDGEAIPSGFVLVRDTSEEAEIVTVAVSQRARRVGVGFALLAHAILELRRAGTKKLFLEVAENNVAAIALYRRLGFAKVGTRKAYYTSQAAGGAAPAALVMQLDLR